MRLFRSSSLFSIALLITANILPAFWTFSGNARPENLLFLYWLETWIIGFYSILKIRKASKIISENEKSLMEKQLFKKFFKEESPSSVTALFAVQYAFITVLYGVFLLCILIPFFLVKGGSYFDRLTAILPGIRQRAGFFVLLFAYVVSHGISYVQNYVGHREFEKTSPVYQMLQPYDRIIAMHLFVVFGAIVFGSFSKIGIIFIKLFTDLATHIKEHMIEIAEGGEKQKKSDEIKILEKNVPFWIQRGFLFLVIAVVVLGTIAAFRTAKKNSLHSLPVPLLTTNQSVRDNLLLNEADEISNVVNIQTKASSELNVVFVSFGYKDFAVFRQDADRLGKYLLSRQPFSEFASLFRFHLLETADDFGCRDVTEKDEVYIGGKLTRLNCDGEKIRQAVKDSKLPYNRTVVLINGPNLKGMDTVNGFMTIEWGGIASDENIVLVDTARNEFNGVFVHEFGHSFGLADEYLLYQIPGPEKDFCPDNCCHSNACSSWKDIPGALCIQGCSYPNWYRSSEESTMRQAYNENFSPASLDILRRRLLRHTQPEFVTGSLGINWNKPHPGINPEAHEGDTLSFSGETWNRGAKAAGPSFMSGRLDIDSDGKWDITLPQVPVGGLAPDMAQKHLWNIGWIATSGRHIFEVCTDVTNIVIEADDKNNCKSYDFTVQKKLEIY